MSKDHHHDHDHHDHSHDHEHSHEEIDWRDNGVKVIPGTQLDPNTAQTPGMNRATAINNERAGGFVSGPTFREANVASARA